MMCLRNSVFEDLHAGPVLLTATGSYSDVVVLGADSNRIPYPNSTGTCFFLFTVREKTSGRA